MNKIKVLIIILLSMLALSILFNYSTQYFKSQKSSQIVNKCTKFMEQFKEYLEKTKGGGLELVNVDIEVIYEDDVYYRYAWELTLRNLENNPISADAKIQWLDANGFELESQAEKGLYLLPREEKTFTGTRLLLYDVGSKVYNVTATAEKSQVY